MGREVNTPTITIPVSSGRVRSVLLGISTALSDDDEARGLTVSRLTLGSGS
jgi:hypothetical protein